MAITVECHTDPGVFARLAPEWLELLAGSDLDPVFLHPTLLDCWWRAFGGGPLRLELLTAREDGRLLAVAPLMASTALGVTNLRTIGTFDGQLDYGGIIFPRERPDVLAPLLAHLGRRGDWHKLKIRHVPARSGLAEPLAAAAAGAGFLMRRRVLTQCPYCLLPADYSSLLAALRRKVRQDVNRNRRRLSGRGRVEYRVVTEEAERLALLPVLYDQRIRRWHARGLPSVFTDPRFDIFHRLMVTEFARTGLLHFSGLFLDGRPAALHFGFATPDRFYMYKTTFDLGLADCSPGLVLLSHLLERAILDGRRIYDLILGTEDYKRFWTSGLCPNEELRLYPDTLFAKLVNRHGR